jgi:hypothetical protein
MEMRREFMTGAIVVVAGYAVLIVMLLAGAALTDPGGWAGMALLWGPVTITALLAALVWWQPSIGAILSVAVGAGAGALAFLDTQLVVLPEWAQGLSQLVPAAAFVVIAAYAVKHPLVGGGLMLVVAALVAVARPDVALFVAGPPALAGALFVAAGAIGSRQVAAAVPR